MVKRFNITFVIPILCLILAALWGLLHGVNAGLLMMVNAVISTLVISGVVFLLLSKVLSVNSHFLNYSKSRLSLTGFVTSIIVIGLVVLTSIISYSTGMSFLKTIYSLFFNSRVYTYQVNINQNLIAMYSGTYLMILSIKYFTNRNLFQNLNKIYSKNIYIFLSLLVIIFIVYQIPDFYKYKIIISAFWALLSYLFIEMFIDYFKTESNDDFNELGRASVVLIMMCLTACILASSIVGVSLTSDLLVVLLGLVIGFFIFYRLINNPSKIENLNNNKYYVTSIYSIISFISATCLFRVIGWNISQILVVIIILIISVFLVFRAAKKI